MLLRTSCIEFEPSEHGTIRRNQRDIKIRDLQAAVKYGIREPGYPCRRDGTPRWKFTYAGVVYITDETCTKEITSYAVEIPFQKAIINGRTTDQYLESKRRISSNNLFIQSHSVIVVDKSGSMKSSDLNGFRTRAKAVYNCIAEDFIAPQLHCQRVEGVADVVTLIEMRDSPQLIFKNEPISWVLYNKIIDMADLNDCRSHGHYYPTFKKAYEIMTSEEYRHCSSSLIFLSDGAPSDHKISYINEFPANLYNLITCLCKSLGSKLSFTTVGFGECNFQVLQEMSLTAKAAGSSGDFFRSGINSDALSMALQSSLASLAESKRMLSSIDVTKSSNNEANKKKLLQNKETYSNKPDLHDPRMWQIYQSDHTMTAKRFNIIFEKRNNRFVPKINEVPLLHSESTGFSICKEYLGEGAERIVYKFTEIDNRNNPVGDPLVSKDSKYDLDDNISQFKFHEKFLTTQMKANSFAIKFNRRLEQLNLNIPRISFLEASIYSWAFKDKKTFNKNDLSVLVEKRLDTKYYHKWNDNCGGVDGLDRDTFDKLFKDNANDIPNYKSVDLPIIIENENEDDEDSDNENYDDDVEFPINRLWLKIL
mmetsp:Transcript_12277/g.11106  ORF Transcript_12277/g.11106 Transcript_12277/m.11106 type:complete len:593 (+) Transcript_12277:121-1899(+)